jgi:hypothetical protein
MLSRIIGQTKCIIELSRIIRNRSARARSGPGRRGANHFFGRQLHHRTGAGAANHATARARTVLSADDSNRTTQADSESQDESPADAWKQNPHLEQILSLCRGFSRSKPSVILNRNAANMANFGLAGKKNMI